jgi:hypothetical protein
MGVSSLIFIALVVAAVFGLVFWFGKSGTFLIRITPSGAKAVRGQVPRGFVSDCAEIARTTRLKRGEIRAVGRGDRVKLKFSKEIPGHHHQRFRNALHARRR